MNDNGELLVNDLVVISIIVEFVTTTIIMMMIIVNMSFKKEMEKLKYLFLQLKFKNQNYFFV